MKRCRLPALVGAAAVAGAASLAHAGSLHPRVTFATNAVRVASELKYCVDGGPCTTELRALAKPLPVARGGLVRMTFRPAPRRVQVAYPGGRLYARATRTGPAAWTFRVDAQQRFPQALLLGAHYGRAHGTLGFTIVRAG